MYVYTFHAHRARVDCHTQKASVSCYFLGGKPDGWGEGGGQGTGLKGTF